MKVEINGLKLPKLGITEESDVFGQGLLDPIAPEEFEGEVKKNGKK